MKNEGLCKQVSMKLSLGEVAAIGVVLHDYLKEKHGITSTASLKKLVDEQMKSNKNKSGLILGVVAVYLTIDRIVTKELASELINSAKSAVNKCEESKHAQK